MIERQPPVRHTEVVCIRSVRVRSIIVDERRHGGDALLQRSHRLIDERTQPSIREGHGSLYTLGIVVAEEPDTPVIATGVLATKILEDELLRQPMLTQPLCDVEVRDREGIHIHLRLIEEVLIARRRLELYPTPLIAEEIAQRSRVTLVALGGIGRKWEWLLGTRVVCAVGEATLLDVVAREGERHLKLLRRAILELSEAAYHTQAVLIGLTGLIIEVATAGRPREAVAQPHLIGEAEGLLDGATQEAVRACGELRFTPRLVEGRARVVVDDARHRIAPVERTLRAT